MFKFRKKAEKDSGESLVIPQHIGIIMDGNGRWAKQRMQPRVMGHKAGMEALQKVTMEASRLGVKALTVYAFSTENWTRPEKEVQFIMNLPVDFYEHYVPELHANGVKIQMIGDHGRLPEATLDALRRAEQKTCHNEGLILNFALNYGGRAEIISAVKEIVDDVLAHNLRPEQIDETLMADYLLTRSLPELIRDPELIIRTSGEIRLSNFLPWQSAYSEFYFTDVLWPDFDEAGLLTAIEAYNNRQRRFGGV